MPGPSLDARPAASPIDPLGVTAPPPPFRLPGEHFAAALVFLALGSVGLVVVAPELAVGAYPSVRVIGVTHLFTLGWITTSIMGALYQFVPVALGRSIRSVRLAHWTFAIYGAGLSLFVGGLLVGRTAAALVGALALAVGVGLFLTNLGATLARAPGRDVTWWALAGAAFFLLLTLIVGLALATNLWSGFLGEHRFLALGVHLHLALGGWVGLVIVGVGHRLLPMFLLSHGVGEAPVRWAVGLIASGAGALAMFHHASEPLSRWGPALLMGAGLACFLVQAARLYRNRVRRSLDPGMRLAAVALALLAVGLVLAGPVVVGGADPRLATAYVAVIVGGVSLFVAAHYYKIVPFLVWYHRFGPLAGRGPVPRVSELYHAPTAYGAAVLLTLGVVGVVSGVLLGHGTVVRTAAGVLTAGVGLEALQMLGLARRRPA